METSVMDDPNCYEIPIRSRSVSRVFVASDFGLELTEDGRGSSVRIENPLAVVTERAGRALDTAAAEGMGPALGVYGKIVVSCAGLRNGGKGVEVMFHPGVTFWVEPAGSLGEPICYAGRGLVLLCTPKGQIALWVGMRSTAHAAC